MSICAGLTLVPHVGYHGVRIDPRITPEWADWAGTGSGFGKTGSRPFCLIAAEPGHLQT